MTTTSSRTDTSRRVSFAQAGLPPAESYSFLGLDFRLVTDDAQVGGFFRAAYGRFRRGPREETQAAGGGIELAAILDPARGGPFASVGDRLVELGDRGLPRNRAFLFLLNALMDEVGGYLLIHGAAVSLAGRGLILAGPPTAGKTTLVMELARRGALFLSDDVAPIHRASGLLHPFPRAVGIRKQGSRPEGIDPEAIPPALRHELPHKWLIDPEALGLTLPSPDQPACRLETIFLLEPDGDQGGGRRGMEMGLAEPDEETLDEVRGLPGVTGARIQAGDDFPRLLFEIDRSARPMGPLTALCRRRSDVILYLDEQRPREARRPVEPRLYEASGGAAILSLTRELLNRGESGRLVSECGSGPGLVAEVGRLIAGSRIRRLTPGSISATADVIVRAAGGSSDAAGGSVA